jgi:Lon protease-like protein
VLDFPCFRLYHGVPQRTNPLSTKEFLILQMDYKPFPYVDFPENPRLSYRMSSEFSSADSTAFPIPEIVPVFPLPTVVFFPETYLPLHIFEPRYREMVLDASAQGHCIAMALLKEGWEDPYDKVPPIYPIGCVGRIISSHKLTDGRFNIVLQGLQRCTFEEQAVSTPYRQARIIPHFQRGTSSLDAETRINLELVTRDYLTWKKAHELCQVIASGKLVDSILVHNLSAGLDLSPVEKQFLLESDNLIQQARRLIDLIRFKLADLRTAQG